MRESERRPCDRLSSSGQHPWPAPEDHSMPAEAAGNVAWHYADGFFRFVGHGKKHVDLVASALMDGLKAKDAKIRAMSASVLGELGARVIPAIPALCKALKDRSRQVRWEAARSLGNLGTHALRAIRALIEARHHPDPALQAAADDSLRRIAPDKYAAIILDESLATGSTRPPPAKTVVRYLGDGICQIGSEPSFSIGKRNGVVLEELIKLGVQRSPN